MNTRILTALTRARNTGERAFTMVEVALALGVIGFALVAIVGILPIGMTAQKNNREDTIINQDSVYLLAAIRNGMGGVNDLTNYVDYIAVTNWLSNGKFNVTNHAVPPPTGTVNGTNYDLYSGTNIIKYFSMLKYSTVTNKDLSVINQTNTVAVYMRALTGSATEMGGSNQFMAFRYQVCPEIVPAFYSYTNLDETNWSAYTNMSLDYIDRSNRWEQVRRMTNNLYEVRLKFSWPALPNGKVGKNSQVIRSMVSGAQDSDGLFIPSSYIPQ